MRRALQIGGIMLLAVGASFGSDQKAPKDPPPPPPPAAPKVAPPKGGVPAAGIPRGGQRLVNPTNVVTRLFRMSPEERDRAMEKWQPQQQENAKKLLAWFDSLPNEQQQMQFRRIERFEQLTPEKKAEVRQMFMALQQLPAARKVAVGRELFRLQQMTDQQREATLRRPFFQSRFSPEELRIITGLADAWMGPL
jgi:hypothetical protein